MVVLGGDPHEAVELVDLAAPHPRGLALVLAVRGPGVDRLVEQREVVVGDLEELVLRAGTLLHRVVHPAADGAPPAPGPGRAHHDADLHGCPPRRLRCGIA